jgi:hypothetical protein
MHSRGRGGELKGIYRGEQKTKHRDMLCQTDEGRKRVLLIAVSILAARKLAQFDRGARVPATVSAIADAIRWAEQDDSEPQPMSGRRS